MKFIIQKLVSHQDSNAVWMDVKDTDETLREASKPAMFIAY